MHTLAWLTAIAIALHNLEEMIRLPAWSQEPNRIIKPLDAGEFRFAAGIIALIALALPYGAAQGIMPDLLFHILAGFAVAMIFNTIAPHLVLSLATRSYMTGLGTGLGLVTPACVSYLISTQMRFVEIIWWGFVVGVPLALAIPVLFWIKRRFLWD